MHKRFEKHWLFLCTSSSQSHKWLFSYQRKRIKQKEHTWWLKLPSPQKTGIHFIFTKKQSTCTYIRILLKDTEVRHLCREKTTIKLLHSVQNEILKVPFYSSNLNPGISVFTANKHSHYVFFIFSLKWADMGTFALKWTKNLQIQPLQVMYYKTYIFK